MIKNDTAAMSRKPNLIKRRNGALIYPLSFLPQKSLLQKVCYKSKLFEDNNIQDVIWGNEQDVGQMDRIDYGNRIFCDFFGFYRLFDYNRKVVIFSGQA